jgi:hypothetical protein
MHVQDWCERLLAITKQIETLDAAYNELLAEQIEGGKDALADTLRQTWKAIGLQDDRAEPARARQQALENKITRSAPYVGDSFYKALTMLQKRLAEAIAAGGQGKERFIVTANFGLVTILDGRLAVGIVESLPASHPLKTLLRPEEYLQLAGNVTGTGLVLGVVETRDKPRAFYLEAEAIRLTREHRNEQLKRQAEREWQRDEYDRYLNRHDAKSPEKREHELLSRVAQLESQLAAQK